MLHHHLTGKTAKLLKSRISTEAPLEIARSLWHWNVNHFHFNKSKYLAYINSGSHYVVLISHFRNEQAKHLNAVFLQRWREQLQHDEILSNEVFDTALMPLCQQASCHTSNNDRRTLGRLNQAIEEFIVGVLYAQEDAKRVEFVEFNYRINTMAKNLYTETRRDYMCPRKEMERLLTDVL